MRIVGIIAEYNPFHLGHSALIQKVRSEGATYIVAVMSGNFVQRGEPAVLSKWARARQALSCGVDLVMELPLPWAMAGAEKFALGGVSLLKELGADTIAFGSECGNIQPLEIAANLLLSTEFKTVLQKHLNSGITFAAARQKSLQELAGNTVSELLRSPNNTLGIEYLKAIQSLGADLAPYTMKRTGPAHDSGDICSGIASASHIRSLLADSRTDWDAFLPDASAAVLRSELEAGRAPADFRYLERAVLAKLRGMDAESIARLPDVSEGLENRILAAVRTAGTLEDLYAAVKSKRYTHARIRRIVLSAFLGLESGLSAGLPPYLRILGFTQNGRELLPMIKMTTKLPIITNSSDIFSLDSTAANVFELERKASDLYALSLPRVAPMGRELTEGILVL